MQKSKNTNETFWVIFNHVKLSNSSFIDFAAFQQLFWTLKSFAGDKSTWKANFCKHPTNMCASYICSIILTLYK